jgi:autotransporter-associated beta strand protein
MLAGAQWAAAAALTWNGATTANWADGSNWTPSGQPTLSDDATFPGTIPGSGATILLPAGAGSPPVGGALINNLTFNNSYTLTGGDLTFGASQSINVASGFTTTINSRLWDGGLKGYLKKYGSGTLIFNGDNRSYNVYMDVLSGVLSLRSDNSVPGAYLHVQGGQVQIQDNISVPSGKRIYLSYSDSDASPRVRSVSGNNIWGGDMVLHLNAGDKHIGVDAGSTLTIVGGISESSSGTAGPRNLVKVGGGTLVLRGGSSYTGSTQIKEGMIQLDAGNDRLPKGTSLVLGTSTTAGALDLNGRNQEIAGLTTGGSGANRIVNSSGTASALTVKIASGSNVYNGALGDVGQNNFSLTKSGSGTLVLAGSATYTGATAVTDGTLQLSGAANRLPTATTVTLGSGATGGILDLNGLGQQLAGLTTSGSGTNRVVNSSSTAAALTLNIASGSNTFAGILGNAGQDNFSLTKGGAGTLVLSGQNTYSGATVINDGTLQLAGGNDRLNPSGGMTIKPGKTFDLNGQNQTLTALSCQGSKVLLGSGVLTLGNGGGSSDFWGGSTLTGTTGGLTKIGTGILYLGGTSSYAGGTNVNAGLLALYNGNDRLPTTGDVTVASGARLDLSYYTVNGTVQTINRLSGAGRVTVGASGTVNHASLSTLVAGNGDGSSQFDGVIEDGNGALALTKTGSGRLTLTGANTYSGATNVTGGTLNIQNSSALGSAVGGTSVADGMTLELQNNITVASEALTLGGVNSMLRNVSGNNTWGGSVTANSGFTVSVDSGSLELAGPISSNNNSTVRKVGDGTLLVDGSVAGNVEIDAGLWGGSTTINGSTQVNAGGTISAGHSSGHLTTTGDYSQAGTLLAELAGLSQGAALGGYDWIEVQGAATLGGTVQVKLLDGFQPLTGATFDILTAAGGITNADLSNVAFDFSQAQLTTPALQWQAQIAAGSVGEVLRLSIAAPEPSSLLLAFLGLAGLGVLARRRKGP